MPIPRGPLAFATLALAVLALSSGAAARTLLDRVTVGGQAFGGTSEGTSTGTTTVTDCGTPAGTSASCTNGVCSLERTCEDGTIMQCTGYEVPIGGTPDTFEPPDEACTFDGAPGSARPTGTLQRLEHSF